MGFVLNETVIRKLCGRFACEDGEELLREGGVRFMDGDPALEPFAADIRDKAERFRVHADISDPEEIRAECDCPAYHPEDQYCRHIAAVLLAYHRGTSGPAAVPGNADFPSIADKVLALFDDTPRIPTRAGRLFDSRTVLSAEFLVKVQASGAAPGFLLELKIGPKRLFAVKEPAVLLDRMERREPYSFTRSFTYDPELYSFRPEDDAVLRGLVRLVHGEALYPEMPGSAGVGRGIFIPPSRWKELLPLLRAAGSAKLSSGGRVYEGLRAGEGVIPLTFVFDRGAGSAEEYRLTVKEPEDFVLLPAYETAVADGVLYPLASEQASKLAGLKRIMEEARSSRIPVRSDTAEVYLEKVIPSLRRIGTVHLTEPVSRQLVQTPLKASLYLDRVKDRLLAGLEFQYGPILINPLEHARTVREENGLLVRDGEAEREILELMARCPFVETEGGYVLADQEEEFDFLYRVLPQLGKKLRVYATTAVKLNMEFIQTAPSIKVELEERTEWLEFSFDIEGIPEAEIRRVMQSLTEKRRFHRLKNGMLLPLDTDEFRAITAFLTDPDLGKWDKANRVRVPVLRGLQALEHTDDVRAVRLGKSLRLLLERLRNPDHTDAPVPAGLAPVLRDYQVYGYQWMKTLASYRFGGILADEMGLGKTVQAIAFLVSVLPEIRQDKQPALVVCPASLMYNWLYEFSRFAPDLRVTVLDGSKEDRLRKSRQEADVMIISYPLLRMDADLSRKAAYHTLILDEAQFIKNHYTQTAQAVKSISARYRFALTGTPVENRLEELWSICEAILPGLFPDRRAFTEMPRETAARRIRPFLLRRLKADCLRELPDKIESLQSSALLPEQRTLYAAYLAELKHEALKHLSAGTLKKQRVRILAGITRLRQLCCHPGLFIEGYKGSSAKFEQLLELLEEYRGLGRRILVFSQFTEMLKRIGSELADRGMPFFYLDGGTPPKERVELCDRYNMGERDLFLMSLKAGGTGLNLTGADTIILYDLWWNPAVEQQAADRAHRIGQKQVVQVIRLVAKGTVEEKMVELQQKKKNLIDEVVHPGHGNLEALTDEDIRELLALDAPGLSAGLAERTDT